MRMPGLDAVSAAFAALARLRGARALHPRGIVLEGTLRLTGARCGVPILDDGGTLPVLARLSKGGGLPGRLPDVLGLAVRVPDAAGPGRPLDLLLSTAGAQGPARLLPLPALRWQATYSSLMRYDVAGRARLFVARPQAPTAPLAPSLARLEAATAAHPLVFTLSLAGLRGPLLPLGSLELRGPARGDSRSLRFLHTNTVPGLRPRGLLAQVRRAAYAGSQRGA